MHGPRRSAICTGGRSQQDDTVPSTEGLDRVDPADRHAAAGCCLRRRASPGSGRRSATTLPFRSGVLCGTPAPRGGSHRTPFRSPGGRDGSTTSRKRTMKCQEQTCSAGSQSSAGESSEGREVPVNHRGHPDHDGSAVRRDGQWQQPRRWRRIEILRPHHDHDAVGSEEHEDRGQSASRRTGRPLERRQPGQQQRTEDKVGNTIDATQKRRPMVLVRAATTAATAGHARAPMTVRPRRHRLVACCSGHGDLASSARGVEELDCATGRVTDESLATAPQSRRLPRGAKGLRD